MHGGNSRKASLSMSGKQAADRIMGFFPRSAASDPEVFLAGLVAILEDYPAWVREMAADPRTGLARRHQFLPSLMDIGAFCQGLIDDRRRHDEMVERWSKPALPNPDRPPPVKNAATRSALCERFGLRHIPAEWDAVAVTQAAAVHGENLPAVVEVMLERQRQMAAASGSVFAQVVDHARAAMDARIAGDPMGEAAE